MSITTEAAERLAVLYLDMAAIYQRKALDSQLPEDLAHAMRYREGAEALRALAKERDELKELNAAFSELTALMQNSLEEDTERIAELTEQLAAAQAVIAKKDEAMRAVASMTDGLEWRICDSALATPSDNTALRQLLEAQREAAAEKVRDLSLEAFPNDKSYAGAFADELRSMPLVIDIKEK